MDQGVIWRVKDYQRIYLEVFEVSEEEDDLVEDKQGEKIF